LHRFTEIFPSSYNASRNALTLEGGEGIGGEGRGGVGRIGEEEMGEEGFFCIIPGNF
jgi:hypothetical protein